MPDPLVGGEPAPLHAQASLARELTAGDGFAIVAGSVIGSGIFLVPGTIALHLRSLPSVMAVWVVGGLLSLFGALSLAELGSMFPGAGGLYVYLREAYGRAVAFLYGWGLLVMIQTGSIATLAAGFALYLSQFVRVSALEMKLLAAGSVVALTAVNLLSLRHAKRVQNIGTAAKFLGLAVLVLFLFWRGQPALLLKNWELHAPFEILGFGVALIAVLWAYEGWHVVSFTAAEFRNPQRDLPRSLVWGTATVAGVYLIVNLAYYAVLPASAVAGAPSAAASAVQHVQQAGMLRFVSCLIVASIVVAMNGMILTGPRVYYAMARDGIFFRTLGKTNSRQVPVPAIVVQGIWAAVLTLAGNFEQLFTWVVFTAWIFYGLAVGGVIVLRIRRPEQTRPFLIPAYPILTLLFVAAAAVIVCSTIVSAPVHAAIGSGAILLGLPVYLVYRTRPASGPALAVATKIDP